MKTPVQKNKSRKNFLEHYTNSSSLSRINLSRKQFSGNNKRIVVSGNNNSSGKLHFNIDRKNISTHITSENFANKYQGFSKSELWIKLLLRKINIKSIFKRKIEDFLDLEPNWDGYNADPVSSDTINLGKQVIDVLVNENIIIDLIVPMRDGGIQFDFSGKEHEIELEIHPNKSMTLIVYDRNFNIVVNEKVAINDLQKIGFYQ